MTQARFRVMQTHEFFTRRYAASQDTCAMAQALRGRARGVKILVDFRSQVCDITEILVDGPVGT